MAKLRHIALSVPDPWASARFYQEAFGLEKVGEAHSSTADGVYLSDGVICRSAGDGVNMDLRTIIRIGQREIIAGLGNVGGRFKLDAR